MAEFQVKDYKSDRKPTWCPGCGHFGVLNALYMAFAELGLNPESTAVISGIGCSSRAPYFFNTYGMHTLHGRALPVATGLQLSRPEIDVIAISGDGDAFSIGGNHFAHACRRNFDITYIVMDNSIYGLTKGQVSPTSDNGFRTNTTPYGSVEHPVIPLSLALVYGATYVGRGFSGKIKELKELIKGGILHHGFSFINCFSPCVSYNHQNTFEYYRNSLVPVPADHDTSDLGSAISLSMEDSPYHLGLFYEAPERKTVDDLLIEQEQSQNIEGDLPSLLQNIACSYQ
jgi:2-oxoglutarate ferredoxin oxidoreductase subunit beta